MKYSFKVAKLFGIDVYIHITLFLIIAILSYILLITPQPFGYLNANYPEWIKLILSIFSATSLFFAVLLHELAHSLVSKKYGINVKNIVLFIFGGIASIEEIPKEPKKEILISLAGPATSFALALTSYAISLIDLPIFSDFFIVFAYFNAVLAVFNLIPAFPLDGGRVLRGFLASKMNFVKATRMAAEIGKMIAIFMGILGFFVNPWLILIALFIYMGANEEEKMIVVENLLEKIKVAEIMTPNPVVVSADWKVSDVLGLMLKFKHLGYPVVKDGKLVGIVTLKDVMNARGDEKVENVMTKELITIHPNQTAFDAFKLISSNKIGRILVVEDGKLVGIISRTDLMRVLEILEVLDVGK
ncbi:MAG: CBS domain-containing protein [Archaeoglobaceae archaeon]|nr:CBS domain-containing protein [Archaeoglobaceae archaeon]